MANIKVLCKLGAIEVWRDEQLLLSTFDPKKAAAFLTRLGLAGEEILEKVMTY